MDIGSISQEVSLNLSTEISPNDTSVLTVVESAQIMRIMLSSIDLQELTLDYFDLLNSKLPCNQITLEFADQKLKTGKAKSNARLMKISIYYGHPFGTPQHAILCYAFSKILSPVQRKLLSEMHAIFAMSLKHALEYYRISQLATKDMLTGLGNRAHYDESLSKLISICRRNNESFGLLIFDLDNFKRVNDKYGHQEGDEVLIEFGKILLHCLRDSDHAFRFGGDEFCCLLLNSDPKANKRVANRICKAVGNSAIFQKHGVSTSVGATTFQIEDDGNAIFQRADTALLQAKKTGKNMFKAA